MKRARQKGDIDTGKFIESRQKTASMHHHMCMLGATPQDSTLGAAVWLESKAGEQCVQNI